MLDVQAVRRFMVKHWACAMMAEGNMVDEDVDPADALARLEAALDRIAEGARADGARAASPQAAEPASAEVAERLDALIGQLREALATEAPAIEGAATEGQASEVLATEG